MMFTGEEKEFNKVTRRSGCRKIQESGTKASGWNSEVKPVITLITLLSYITCKLQLMRFSGTTCDYINYITWLHYIQITIDEIFRYNLRLHNILHYYFTLHNMNYNLLVVQ